VPANGQRQAGKVVRGAGIGLGAVGISSAQSRALGKFPKQLGDATGVKLCHRQDKRAKGLFNATAHMPIQSVASPEVPGTRGRPPLTGLRLDGVASSLTAVFGLCFCRKCPPLLRHVEQHGFIIMILYLLGYADALGCILPVLFSASHFNPRNESVTITRGINLSSYETDATIVEMELWHVAGRWLSRDWRNNDGLYMPCRIPRNIGGTPKNASEWPKKDRPNIKRRCWELQRLGVNVRASPRRKI
jgi:hypothetical protein